MNLLVTSDTVGSSGNTVASQEFEALNSIDETDVINPQAQNDPFLTDEIALEKYKKLNKKYKLAHFYAGTYSKLIKQLKEDGTKVTYTAAAHDINLSKEEFEKLGYSYDYPHMIVSELFEKYVEGYKNADVVICPSNLSKKLMEEYGCKNVEVIPHGHHKPCKIKPIPDRFILGYLGQPGPDKGLIYLIKAWAELNYSDSQLVIAGRNSSSLLQLIRQYGKGSIFLAGYIESIDQFYNSCSVYVQPSVTEGFGMEVLEAMSYGRPVICSDGAGAVDCINFDNGIIVEKKNVTQLANAINYYKNNPELIKKHGEKAKKDSEHYTWDLIQEDYEVLWSSLLKN